MYREFNFDRISATILLYIYLRELFQTLLKTTIHFVLKFRMHGPTLKPKAQSPFLLASRYC